jgi:hypothetical protein
MKPIIVFFYIIIAAIILAQCTNQQPTPGTGPTEIRPAAPSPTSSPTNLPNLITWQNTGQPCQKLTVTAQAIIFGCFQEAKSVTIRADRAADFLYFTQNLASFTANTPDGILTFSGQGGLAANADQQRSINEWVRLIYKETQSGQTDPTWGLSMDYHRNGGIAGFADTVYVYSAGYAMVSTNNSDPAVYKKVYLDRFHLQQLYRWLDTFKTVKYDQPMPANVADGMSVALGLAGAGKKTASDQNIQAMLSFGSSLATR